MTANHVFNLVTFRDILDDLTAIIKASDGTLITRGDIGIKIHTEKVFITQKQIIAKCNKFGKPIICTNQMLKSMVKEPRPTRQVT